MKHSQNRLATALILAGLATPALILSGCIGGGGSASSGGAHTASVQVGVEFPAAGASAARIDDNTGKVKIMVWDSTASCVLLEGCYSAPTKVATLERPAGGGTVTTQIVGIAPGEAIVKVQQLTSADQALETVQVAAKLTDGSNTMTVTLARARWTLTTPVTFNKIVASDTTRIDSFSLVPFNYAQPVSVGSSFRRGVTPYGVVVRGSNLCYETWNESQEDDEVTCGQDRLPPLTGGSSYMYYYNRFDGGDSSKNQALFSASAEQMDNDIALANDGQGRERAWMAVSALDGVFLGESESDTPSDPDVMNDFKIAVTGASTISGNLMEYLSKSERETPGTCFVYSNTGAKQTVECPNPTAAKARKASSGFRKALLTALAKGKAGKAAANAQGCYIDLQISYTDWNYLGWYNNASVYQNIEVTETLDVCRHPFTATASQLPSDDISISVQSAK